jgi:hypothetical protein
LSATPPQARLGPRHPKVPSQFGRPSAWARLDARVSVVEPLRPDAEASRADGSRRWHDMVVDYAELERHILRLGDKAQVAAHLTVEPVCFGVASHPPELGVVLGAHLRVCAGFGSPNAVSQDRLGAVALYELGQAHHLCLPILRDAGARPKRAGCRVALFSGRTIPRSPDCSQHASPFPASQVSARRAMGGRWVAI